MEPQITPNRVGLGLSLTLPGPLNFIGTLLDSESVRAIPNPIWNHKLQESWWNYEVLGLSLTLPVPPKLPQLYWIRKY